MIHLSISGSLFLYHDLSRILVQVLVPQSSRIRTVEGLHLGKELWLTIVLSTAEVDTLELVSYTSFQADSVSTRVDLIESDIRHLLGGSSK